MHLAVGEIGGVGHSWSTSLNFLTGCGVFWDPTEVQLFIFLVVFLPLLTSPFSTNDTECKMRKDYYCGQLWV